MSIPADLSEFIQAALQEDIGDGDHTSLACIPSQATGTAQLIVKDTGLIAGVELAVLILETFDPTLSCTVLIPDGQAVKPGDIVFKVSGSSRSILTAERLVLNSMQRMSGIATLTHAYVEALKDLPARVIDTRKTTPGLRVLEKWAVRLGGGTNHRHGLFDMILIKDNHIDFAGGISQAIQAVKDYLRNNNLDLKIEIEVRNMEELEAVLSSGGIHRIMLDNFTPEAIREAVGLIAGRYETEASGGITLETIRAYGEAGVDYISVGALTHSATCMDMSLKAC